jgi:signal transduction histidine kinase/CheY-like chemotaxis protein
MKGKEFRMKWLIYGLLSMLVVSIFIGSELQVQGSVINKSSVDLSEVNKTEDQDNRSHKHNTKSLTSDELEYIKDCGIITIGVPNDKCPLSYVDEEAKELKGITVDILQSIGSKLGLKFQFATYQLGEPIEELIKSKRFDFIVPLGGQHDEDYLSNLVRMTKPFNQASIVLASLSDFEYDFPNFKIGLIKDQADYEPYILAKYPKLEIIPYETQTLALLALRSGEVKAIAENIYIFDYLIQSPRYESIKTMTSVFIGLDYCLLQPLAGDTKLFEIINKGIGMITDQETASIIYQYRGNNIYEYTVRDYLYLYRWVILAIIIITIFVVIVTIQRKRNGKTMKQMNAELIEANKSKNKFLSNVSHEIRTPMNAIIGLTSICANHLEDKQVLKQNLEKIDMSAHFLLSLINDILDISRIESGKIVLNEEVVVFDEFILQINNMMEERVEDKGIRYECIVDNSVEAYYIFDRLKLQQIIINILSNAIKFTPRDGKILFQVDQVEVIDNVATLSICISDTGIGIEEKFLPKIFEAFSQENTDNTTEYTGSGLGLAISKNLVNLLNGDIQVSSSKGEGTTFSIKVRVGVAKEYHKLVKTTPQKEQDDHFDFANKRVLLVEDNEINLEVAKTLLEYVGLMVEWVENGKEAVDQFSSSQEGYYNAILMDIRMPVMDGLDAAKAIRKSNHEDAKRIPIIAMTANAFEEDVKKSIKAGMNCHMTKPIEPKILYETLAKVMRE